MVLSNLEAAQHVSMRASIKALHESMQTIFVCVTHDQAEALALADRVVVMGRGVLQQIGSPDDIYERSSQKIRCQFPRQPADQLYRRRADQFIDLQCLG